MKTLDSLEGRVRGRSVVLAVIASAVFGVWLAGPGSASAAPFAQCPAISVDSGCAELITVNADGSVTTASDSQGPIDLVDDTVIGVQNNSPGWVAGMQLSGLDSFDLDKDGLCSGDIEISNFPFPPSLVPFYIPPFGCPFGPTVYEGPHTSIEVLDNSDGTVGFSQTAGGIPSGGSAYFSLDGPVDVQHVTVQYPIIASGTTINTAEGFFIGTVATATDQDSTKLANQFTCSIDWGDGSPLDTSTCTVSGGKGVFTISGVHVYAEEGSYTATATITAVGAPYNTSNATTPVNVADAQLTANCSVSATSTTSFNGTVASLIDSDPGGTSTDYTATIDWGDGSSSAGSVSGPNGGPFAITGTHTYSSTGYHTITTSVTDAGGSTATTGGCSTLTYAFAPGGGAFVIGDLSNVTNAPAMFWGAQWSKQNMLSGGAAPASFKGFALNPTSPTCGTGWNTGPGNSSPPPTGPLPTYMGVIVSSSVTKSGSTISGNTTHITVVKTDPGYAPNPGHAGTGTIITQAC